MVEFIPSDNFFNSIQTVDCSLLKRRLHHFVRQSGYEVHERGNSDLKKKKKIIINRKPNV